MSIGVQAQGLQALGFEPVRFSVNELCSTRRRGCPVVGPPHGPPDPEPLRKYSWYLQVYAFFLL